MTANNKKYVMIMDLDLCVGCRGCEVACRQEHDLKPRIGERLNLKTKRIPYWTKVETVGPFGTFPEVDMFYFPRMCNHCDDAPCVQECPVNAMIKRDDGVVYIDENKCISCLKCTDVCPFNAIFYDKDEDSVSKCNLCIHLIDNGLEPACVSTCMTKARIFGDVNDSESLPGSILKEKEGSIMQIPMPWDSRAVPNVIYVRSKKRKIKE